MARGRSPSGTVERTKDQEFQRAAYPTKYKALVKRVGALRAGQSLKLAVNPKDGKLQMQARVKQALRRGLPDFDHKRFEVRRAPTRHILIVCKKVAG